MIGSLLHQAFERPGWLFGLLVLSVPLAIHLLSRGRQRVVPFGSVLWLAEAETMRARRLRLSRRWLLALRCLALAIAIVALAGPRASTGQDAGSPTWVLVSPEVISQRDRVEGQNEAAFDRLDALREQGAAERWVEGPASSGAWAQVLAADREAPPAASFEVFMIDRAEALRGARPSLGREVIWHALVDPDRNRWLESAEVAATYEDATYEDATYEDATYEDATHEDATIEGGALSGGAGVVVVIGESEAAQTRYRTVIAGGPAGDEAVLLEPRAEGWRLTLRDGGSLSEDDVLEVAPADSLRAVIVASSERARDSEYVRRGLEAVEEIAPFALNLRQESPLSLEAASGDLIFWLSSDPVPAALVERVAQGATLVSDVLGRSELCDCVVEVGAREVLFDRVGPVDDESGAEHPATGAVWRDVTGRAVLEIARHGAGRWHRFHSRFSLGWTDLVLQPAFPEWLLTLAVEARGPLSTAWVATSDRRVAIPGEARLTAGQGAAASAGARSRAGRWLWCVVAMLLMFERRVAMGGLV